MTEMTETDTERLKAAFALGAQAAMAVADYQMAEGMTPQIDMSCATDRAALLMVLSSFAAADECREDVVDVLPSIREVLMSEADTMAEVERLAGIAQN